MTRSKGHFLFVISRREFKLLGYSVKYVVLLPNRINLRMLLRRRCILISHIKIVVKRVRHRVRNFYCVNMEWNDPKTPLNSEPIFLKLKDFHQRQGKDINILELFKEDSSRFEKFRYVLRMNIVAFILRLTLLL